MNMKFVNKQTRSILTCKGLKWAKPSFSQWEGEIEARVETKEAVKTQGRCRLPYGKNGANVVKNRRRGLGCGCVSWGLDSWRCGCSERRYSLARSLGRKRLILRVLDRNRWGGVSWLDGWSYV